MNLHEPCPKHSETPEEELARAIEAAPAVKPYVEGRRVRCLACFVEWLRASVQHLEIWK